MIRHQQHHHIQSFHQRFHIRKLFFIPPKSFHKYLTFQHIDNSLSLFIIERLQTLHLLEVLIRRLWTLK